MNKDRETLKKIRDVHREAADIMDRLIELDLKEEERELTKEEINEVEGLVGRLVLKNIEAQKLI